MRPSFSSDLVNGPFGDPALLIDFKFEARAKRAIPYHFSPRYADREAALRAELERAWMGAKGARGSGASRPRVTRPV